MKKTKNKLPTPDTNPVDGDKLIEETMPTKKTRMFAAFQNREHMTERMEDLLNKIPKKYKADLWLWIGQYESTLAEGFTDDE